MQNGLKVFYANIEKGLHLEKLTLPEVKMRKPDVEAFLEVRRDHLEYINDELGTRSIFFAYVKGAKEGFYGIPEGIRFGSAIFISKDLELIDHGNFIYHLVDRKGVPALSQDPVKMNRSVLWVKVRKGTTVYTLLLTHFTWVPDSVTSAEQLKDLNKMLKMIHEEENIRENFVFVGDLNSPRISPLARPPYSPNAKTEIRGEIWAKLAEFYNDNVPLDVSSTIDPARHRVPEIISCVDFCFSHGDHKISSTGVEVVEGVSDHKGLFFEIVRKS